MTASQSVVDHVHQLPISLFMQDTISEIRPRTENGKKKSNEPHFFLLFSSLLYLPMIPTRL